MKGGMKGYAPQFQANAIQQGAAAQGLQAAPQGAPQNVAQQNAPQLADGQQL